MCQLPFQLLLRPDTHSACLFYRPPPTIDTLSPSVCRLPLFQQPLRSDTSSLSLCRSCVFFNFASSFFRQRHSFLLYRLPLSSTSVCRLRVFNFRCAFVLVINWDTAISVKFLVLTRLFAFRRFFVSCANFSLFKRNRGYRSVELGDCTVIERDNRVFSFSFSCSSETEVTTALAW